MLALITGVDGQDGYYLRSYLEERSYEVYGMSRRGRGTFDARIVYGDLRDGSSIESAIHKTWPDEIYNLGAQPFVPQSWVDAADTMNINVGGLARVLQAVERIKPDTKVYQAGTSEMFGERDGLCDEETPFAPASPYGVAKMAAHRLVQIYRQKGLYVVGGILGNHESYRRANGMVTKKIIAAVAAWIQGRECPLRLGNMTARRDWGFAGDYVAAMHAMLQQPSPGDFVIGTGVSRSVGDFLDCAVHQGEIIAGHELVRHVVADPLLRRPNEIWDQRLCATRARRELGWTPMTEFPAMVEDMLRMELCNNGDRASRS